MKHELEEIYLRAIQLEGSDRQQYLDESLVKLEDRETIDKLLAQQAAAGDYFEGLGDRFNTLLEEPEQGANLPDQIGDYKPTRLLGRGGMGEVYLASRTDGQFDKDVAIKVLPAALIGPQAADLFVRERQILARLDHPNICHLLDGGMSESGGPYFVMEHIDGLQIDQYADRQQLSIEHRLGLFLQVCDAVEHAHQNLTLHRDLKPSNILVNESGQVKLLDFGVAKVIEETAADAVHAPTTHLPVTPKFAAPEQLLRQPVSTRTDVYGLGMLLYWLLAGVDAHNLEQDGTPQNLRILSEEDATLASRRLRKLLVEADSKSRIEQVAKQRQLSANSLIERLGGDLENILAKALKRAPTERYSAASSLADDIRRHLAHRPVLAGPDSFIYNASRFIRRHRLPVALSAVIASLVIALAGGAVWTAWKQQQQNRALIAQTERADATKDFLVSVFQAVHPNQSQGESLTALELLDSGVQRAQQELEDQPELQAELTGTFANIYGVLGKYDRAAQLWQQELILREQLAGAQSAEFADVLDNLSRISSARGRQQDAKQFAERAVAIRLTIDDPLGLANSRMRVAGIARNERELDKAETIYREVLPVFAAHYLEDQHTMALTHLGNVLRYKGEYDEALSFVQQALAQQLQWHGESEAFTAQVLQDLGAIQRAMDRPEEAEQSYQRALTIAEKLFGPDHREVAYALSGLAQLAEINGDPSLAEQRHLRGQKIFTAMLSPGHPNIGVGKLNLGAFYRRQSQCSKAQLVLREGLEIMQKALPTHGSVAKGQRHLAYCVRQADPKEAEQLLLTAHATQTGQLGSAHKETQATAADLVALYQQQGQPENAARFQVVDGSEAPDETSAP